MKIYLATGNKNKISEMKKILEDLNIEVLGVSDLGIDKFEVVEDGKTLEENSIKKAKELKKYTEDMVVADDSGLFVNSLGGEPGIYSARYGGEDGNDQLNNEKLLSRLRDKEDRSAEFRTVITLIDGDDIITKTGICKGRIDFEPRGENGFGYDPLFIPEGYHRSFAELDGSIKNKISHRRRALDQLYNYLDSKLKG